MAKIIISYLFNRLLWKEWFPFGSDGTHDFMHGHIDIITDPSNAAIPIEMDRGGDLGKVNRYRIACISLDSFLN